MPPAVLQLDIILDATYAEEPEPKVVKLSKKTTRSAENVDPNETECCTSPALVIAKLHLFPVAIF